MPQTLYYPLVVIYRVVVLAKVLGNGQFFGTVVVRQTLRNQKWLLREIPRKILVGIETQALRRATAIGLSKFLHNVRFDYFEGVCHIEGGKVHRFQLSGYDSSQQIQAVVTFSHGDAPGTHFHTPSRSEKICPLSAALFFHPLP